MNLDKQIFQEKKPKVEKKNSNEIMPRIDISESRENLGSKLADSKSHQEEFMADIDNKMTDESIRELARLEAINLTGNIVEDTRQVLEAHGSTSSDSDIVEALEKEDKSQLREIIKEWLTSGDSFMVGTPIISPALMVVLTKKRELLSNILKSSESRENLGSKLADSKSHQEEFMADIDNKMTDESIRELARLEAINLTGNIVEDTRQVLEAHGSTSSDSDIVEALEKEDKSQLREIIKEWLTSIDSSLVVNGAINEKRMPPIDDPALAVLTKKCELFLNILKSSE